MTQVRHTFHWSPGDPGGDMKLRKPLAARLQPLLEDRTSTAQEVILEASGILCSWLRELPESDGFQLGTLLGTELDPLLAVHGWRAPVQLWMRTLDRVVRHTSLGRDSLRDGLIEELGLWMGGIDVDFRQEGAEPPLVWNGGPLEPGRRLPDRASCSEALVEGVDVGEVICIPAFSETVALGVERLVGAGLAPKILLGEGGPNLGGRLMARRLEHLGLEMRLTYDAALPGRMAEVDRLWMGTEAIGADAILATVGVGNLIQAARKNQIPSVVLATSDKLAPLGELRLPEWAAKETYLLWEGPVSGLTVESQFYERLPLWPALQFATEHGLQSPAQLALNALRTDDLA
ncbi:MAG: hypothetical protein KDB61_00195 [Planctomycetes bacterium]|nr:hypothetical protein [Planctomycetota bacterium]